MAGERVEVAAVPPRRPGAEGLARTGSAGGPGRAGFPRPVHRHRPRRDRPPPGRRAERRPRHATIVFDSTSIASATPAAAPESWPALDMDDATFWPSSRDQPAGRSPRWHWRRRPRADRADGSRRVRTCTARITPRSDSPSGSGSIAGPIDLVLSDRDHSPRDPPRGPFGGRSGGRSSAGQGGRGLHAVEPRPGDRSAMAESRGQPAAAGRPCSSSGSRLEDEHDRLVAIFEASDDFVGIADPNGLVIWRNAAYRRSDRSRAALPQSGFPSSPSTPTGRPGSSRDVALPEAARTGSWLGETAIRTADGRLVSDVAAGHGAPGARRRGDATTRRSSATSPRPRRSRAELRRQQQFVQNVVDADPGVLYVVAVPDRRIVWTNGQALSALGYSSEEIQALDPPGWLDMIHPDDSASLDAAWRQASSLLDGEVLEREHRIRHADGSWRWFWNRVVVAGRDATGRPDRLLGVLEDVTPRKRSRGPVAASLQPDHHRLPDHPRAGRDPRMQRGRLSPVRP